MYYLPVRPRGRQRGESGIPLPLRAAALRMVRDGATLADAGREIGVTKQAVHQWCKAAGIIAGRKRKTIPRVVRAEQMQEKVAPSYATVAALSSSF
ncbi:MAG: hypothetical protein EKK29_04960 [Hyphomicrobiales bacterium]|nr:MAG: hypothetical protein EKK29_04960 [Hyphomicrobiales bacterium]